MYDDDIFASLLNSYSGTTTQTETEEKQSQSTSYSPQSGQVYNPYSSVNHDSDDYSIRPNYEEQQSYNTTGQKYDVQEQEQSQVKYEVRQMNAPLLQKDEPAVTLTKSRSKVELQARMKIAISMFAIIFTTLIVAIVWNFVSASKMRATFASKEYEIASLQADIKAMQSSYIKLSDDEKLKADAKEVGYVEQSDSNTIYVDFEEYFKASEKEVSSNWFNDVCDFLSGIFG